MGQNSLIPMSKREKENRRLGIGEFSGYWKWADARRAAMMAPMEDWERRHLTKVPLCVLPKTKDER